MTTAEKVREMLGEDAEAFDKLVRDVWHAENERRTRAKQPPFPLELAERFVAEKVAVTLMMQEKERMETQAQQPQPVGILNWDGTQMREKPQQAHQPKFRREDFRIQPENLGNRRARRAAKRAKRKEYR